MKKEPAINSPYNALLNKIQTEISQGLVRAENAYNKEKILTYWKIGKNIHSHFIQNKVQADFGKKIFTNLSEDLKIGKPLLYQMVQFYKTYNELEPLPNVKWTHYRALSSVKDKDARLQIETQVSTRNLSMKDFEVLVQDYKNALPDKPIKTKKPIAKLTPRRGTLYHYTIIKEDYSDKYLINCGFRIYRETDYTNLPLGIVEAIKTDKGYIFNKSEVKRKFINTYKAYVTKIIDADTIWVKVDLGFGTWTKQKIRFRGIDAPEKGSADYLKSNQYLEDLLKDIPFIVIKSYYRGKYDRFLCDIFYLKDELDPIIILEKGEFLNQKLLDKGLAKVFVK